MSSAAVGSVGELCVVGERVDEVGLAVERQARARGSIRGSGTRAAAAIGVSRKRRASVDDRV